VLLLNVLLKPPEPPQWEQVHRLHRLLKPPEPPQWEQVQLNPLMLQGQLNKLDIDINF
jgi:hypothetical protein